MMMRNCLVLHSSEATPRGARLAAVALLALSLALPRAAWSQSPQVSALPGVSPSQRETARAWVLEGRELFAQKNYAGALERFRAAHQLVHVPTTGLEVARAQAALGQWVEANATAMEVFNLPRSANEPEVFDAAREQASELRRGLAPRIPALRLDVTPRVEELLIQIDGVDMPRGSGSMSFKLNPGRHEIRVRARGYREELRAVELVEKESRTLAITLSAEVHGSAGETVSTGVTTSPPAGSGSVAAEPRSQSPGDDGSPSAGSAARTRGYVALGVAGTAVLVGSVTGVLAFTTKPSCAGDVCDPSLRDETDASLLYGNVATASFGVAIVAGAYGLYELLSNAAPSPSATTELRRGLQPGLMPLKAGAVLHISRDF